MILELSAADLVDALEHRRNVVRKAEHRSHDIEGADQRPFGARAIVSDDVPAARWVRLPVVSAVKVAA